MKKTIKTSGNLCGFSFAEVLVALTIGAMVLVAVLSVYNRSAKSASAVREKLDSSRMPSEVLQRIAEDLDNIITDGLETNITIQNKFVDGYQSARMVIEKNFFDEENEKQTFEKIIWQTSFDFESDKPGLVLYRSHSGLDLEDRLLDKQKSDWETELFVPFCDGITLFKIQALKNDELQDSYSGESLPEAVVVTISFAEPFETLDGSLDVLETEKTKRTIAIDRTRIISFKYVTEYEQGFDDINDVNQTQEGIQDVNELEE
ncbi:type II secretion system protein J [Planctomycetota bacterium]